MGSVAGDRKPFPVLQSEFNELHGVFSPNGQWLAYTSDETGRDQVYVVPFSGRPGPTGTDQRFGAKTLVLPADPVLLGQLAHREQPASIVLHQFAVVGPWATFRTTASRHLRC
jgi:WD40-like Beta Propeller Repeat